MRLYRVDVPLESISRLQVLSILRFVWRRVRPQLVSTQLLPATRAFLQCAKEFHFRVLSAPEPRSCGAPVWVGSLLDGADAEAPGNMESACVNLALGCRLHSGFRPLACLRLRVSGGRNSVAGQSGQAAGVDRQG